MLYTFKSSLDSLAYGGSCLAAYGVCGESLRGLRSKLLRLHQVPACTSRTNAGTDSPLPPTRALVLDSSAGTTRLVLTAVCCYAYRSPWYQY
eukprot:2579132-Rhodomonas_salina.1